MVGKDIGAMENTPEPDGRVDDAVDGNWVDLRAPAWSRPYLRLSRVDRPIGTWLLLLPCWWGALLACLHQGRFGWAEAWVMLGCGIGAVLMRGAGCTWNDITDSDFDRQVTRTASRPIPSGRISVHGALSWMVVQAVAAFAVLVSFGGLAIPLGIGSLVLVAAYPFAKRFTWWPQVFLGLAFNWGALLAWVAVTDALAWPSVFLYLAGIAWTLFYDTIYAHQDKEDDALVGIKSTARLFGDRTRPFLTVFQLLATGLMVIAFLFAMIGTSTGIAIAVALCGPLAFGGHLAWQMGRLDVDDPVGCLGLFRSNRDSGLIVTLFLAAAFLV